MFDWFGWEIMGFVFMCGTKKGVKSRQILGRFWRVWDLLSYQIGGGSVKEEDGVKDAPKFPFLSTW